MVKSKTGQQVFFLYLTPAGDFLYFKTLVNSWASVYYPLAMNKHCLSFLQ